MKIISKYKDYYDYIAHQYGIDEKIIYNRAVCLPKEPSTLNFFIQYKNITENLFNQIKFSWIIICGKQYLCYELNNETFLYTENSDMIKSLNYNHLLPFPSEYKWGRKTKKTPLDFYIGKFTNEHLEFNRKYKTPVIMIKQYGNDVNYYIVPNIPILKDIKGFVKNYPPQKIYQDICYFFSAQLNGNPDINVPVTINDKNRFQQKGFDLKTSFRPKMKENCL